MQPLGNLSGLFRKLPPGEPGIQLVLSGTTIPAAVTLMNSHARGPVAAPAPGPSRTPFPGCPGSFPEMPLGSS